jgi:hypothetical protein
VLVWSKRYGQRAWLRQLQPEVSRDAEDAVLRTIARVDGTPFPTSVGLMTRWVTSRGPSGRWLARARRGKASDESLETAYCAEIVAMTYQAMGLLPADRLPGWYDPGRFWSGDGLILEGGSRLGQEIEVDVPGLGRRDQG